MAETLREYNETAVGTAGVRNEFWKSQSFLATSTYYTTSIDIKLSRLGSLTGSEYYDFDIYNA